LDSLIFVVYPTVMTADEYPRTGQKPKRKGVRL
jgi:hypothetical protein